MREARDDRSLRFVLGGEPAEPLSRGGQVLAAGVVAAAVGAALRMPLPSSWSEMALVAAYVRPFAVALVLLAAFGVRRLTSRGVALPRGYLVADATGVHRESSSSSATTAAATTPTAMLRWNEPFGVTLLASRARDRLVCAVTTPSATRYVGVRVPRDDADARTLLGRASTVSDDDILAISGDDTVRLGATEALTLLTHLQMRAAGAMERIYLTAPRGERIELDGYELRAGERVIDLSAPLEWRAFVFHESGGTVAALYQATWVRQADAELFFVAPTAGEIGFTDEPPPRELRLAIDRVFMLPLRRALERAPRASRPNFPAPRARTERRA